jgi:catechol 2,3-dioxygenase-like lactoylglutathione lyase family enzyme
VRPSAYRARSHAAAVAVPACFARIMSRPSRNGDGLLAPGSPYTSQEDNEAALALVAKGLMPGIIFTTTNVDATFEQLRAAGAEVVQEPIDQPYGVRDCAFRDPSGNHLRFSQVAKPS